MKINTIAIGGNLHQAVNLQELSRIGSAMRVTNNGGYLTLNDKITACIFKTGKVQIYGIKTIDDIRQFWDKTLAILRKLNPLPNADLEAKIKFIVASEKLPYTLNLHIVLESFPTEFMEYEPEQFPGLIWKFTCGTCLLFTSGNIIITGPNSIEKIEKTIAELREKIDPLFI